MKENAIFPRLFYFSSVFGKVVYGKKRLKQLRHHISRLQAKTAKGQTWTLQMGKDTYNFWMRKIYQSYRVNDKNVFRKQKNTLSSWLLYRRHQGCESCINLNFSGFSFAAAKVVSTTAMIFFMFNWALYLLLLQAINRRFNDAFVFSSLIIINLKTQNIIILIDLLLFYIGL